MSVHGDPVRLAYSGTPGSTSAAIGIYYPGTNSTYPFSSTDFLIIDAFTCNCQDGDWGAITSSPQGSSTVVSSTLLASIGSQYTSGVWLDPGTEACSGVQGVIPSIFTKFSNSLVIFGGTGHVVHSPGTSRPSWMAANS